MPLGGPLDHFAELPSSSSLGPAVDHFGDIIPAASLGGHADLDAIGIPGKSLGSPHDHEAKDFKPGFGPPLDHVATLPNVLPQVPSGSRALNPGLNLVVLNTSPQAVKLGWNAITEADLADDDLIYNVETKTFAVAGSFPADITAGGRTVLGYKLHRGVPTVGGFTPEGIAAGDGNCIADELVLTPGVDEYVDGDVLSNNTYAYRLALVVSGA